MTTTAQRPVTTLRQPTTPMPLWEAAKVFQEPTYTDGQPYTDDLDDEEDADAA